MTQAHRLRLADALRELAALLELDGANQFKSGAYQRAARTLADYTGDLGALVEAGTLTSIDGIGKGIAEKVTEYCRTGTIAELEELRARIPAGMLQMAEIPGLGAKKVRALHEQLGVTDLDSLEAAARDGRLASLKGFGEKTAVNILAGIEQRRRHTGRFHLDVADALSAPVLEDLRRLPMVVRAEVAGSLRRRMETVKDLDFIVATNEPGPVMEFFTTLPGIARVTGKGTTKSSIVLGNGMGADLRCVAPEQFPFALHHFTGSKDHNTAMRRRAKDRGLTMNEYGLFPEGSDASLPAATEEEVFAHLGLAWIPPELREAMGEIEAAEAGALPALVGSADILGLPHMHTQWSDGAPTVEDYAAYARDMDIAWMGISDHSQTAAYAGGLTPERVAQQHAEIDRVNAQSGGGRLLKGIESDILADGSLDYTDEVLATFDFVVASVHSHFTLPEEQQTERIIRALRNPHTTILGHPTGRLLLRRDGYACDLRRILAVAAEEGVAVEINGNPWRLELDWRLVRHALELGCHISLGPDAHAMAGLLHAEYALAMGRKGWLTRERCINCLTREEFLAFARRRRNR
jgi:DNA polymerase (family 10)